MSWLVVKRALMSTWLWLKTYWQVPVLAAWSVIVYILSKRSTDALVEVMNAKKESYEKQINELKTRHNNEIMERDRLIKQYHETVSAIEKKYEEQEKKLEAKEKRKIKEIVKKSKGEPDVIKAEIEKSFGFVFVD
tara:strand:- start:711 stop:1115 length:405 start_codon:yes stop_codon:yes gene_type:complete